MNTIRTNTEELTEMLRAAWSDGFQAAASATDDFIDGGRESSLIYADDIARDLIRYEVEE